MALTKTINKSKKRITIYGSGTFLALFTLLASLYLYGVTIETSGDIVCGRTCESYFNITLSNYSLCFGSTFKGVYLEDATYELYKADMRYRSDNPLRWKPYELKSGVCLDPGKKYEFKLVGHKKTSANIKWGVMYDGFNADPYWIGSPDIENGTIQYIGVIGTATYNITSQDQEAGTTTFTNTSTSQNVRTGVMSPNANAVLLATGWLNMGGGSPTNVYTDNVAWAQARGTRTNASAFFGYNASHMIPFGSVILGIQVMLHRNETNITGTNNIALRLSNNCGATYAGNENLTAEPTTSADQLVTAGAINSLWGLAWNVTGANCIRVNATTVIANTGFLRIAYIGINITYTNYTNMVETNNSYVQYTTMNGSDYQNVDQVKATVTVSSYNPAGSNSTYNSNVRPMIEVNFWNGTNWKNGYLINISAVMGKEALNSTVTNFTVTATTQDIKDAWKKQGNRSIQIRGVYIDTNSTLKDEINVTGVYGYVDAFNNTYETDADKSYTTYDNALTNSYGTILNVSVTINITSYNNTASSTKGNANPDIYLELANGSGTWYEVGGFGINGLGNFTLYSAEQGVLDWWMLSDDNIDIRVRGRGFDSGSWDEINYTDIWLMIDDPVYPAYSLNSTNSTLVGSDILHKLYWQDTTGLSGFIFSFCNGTWTGSSCGAGWVNDSWVSMTGTGNWSNVTKSVNKTVGASIAWFIWANNSLNLINQSEVFSYVTTNIININDCSNMTVAGSTYILTNNIVNSGTSYCMNISANNITLDCQNYEIDGNDAADYGIYLKRNNEQTVNVTVQNCNVRDWDTDAISDYNGDYFNMYNVTINSSYYGSAVFTYSKYITINNVTIDASSSWGFRFETSNIVVINNSKSKSKEWDLYMYTPSMCNFKLENFNGSNGKSFIFSNVTTNITNWNDNMSGIILCGSGASNSTISNITMNGVLPTPANGILLVGINNTLIENSTFYAMYDALYLISSTWNTINNNTLNYTQNDEIYFSASHNNTVTRTKTLRSSNIGYRFDSNSADNRIYNNLINGSSRINLNAVNYWNTTNQTGKRIYSNGSYMSGNYWTNSTNNGYSDTCTDTDTDGYCDSPLNISNLKPCTPGVDCGINVDYLPYSNKYSAITDTCSCPASGNWAGLCSDNCVISSNCNMQGNNVTITGTGVWTLSANITNFNVVTLKGTSAADQCIVRCTAAGCFRK